MSCCFYGNRFSKGVWLKKKNFFEFGVGTATLKDWGEEEYTCVA